MNTLLSCQKHFGKPLLKFCRTCSFPVCEECLNPTDSGTGHKDYYWLVPYDHLFISIEDWKQILEKSLKSKKDEIKKYLKNIEAQAEDQISKLGEISEVEARSLDYEVECLTRMQPPFLKN